MMTDLDYDMPMPLQPLPIADSDENDDSVQWTSSQTTNRALDSLMLEAQNARQRNRVSEWSWDTPVASTSAPALFEPSASMAHAPAAPAATRRRTRGATRATSLESLPPTDSAFFMKLVKGVSQQADENAGMRTAARAMTSSSDGSGRKGVKERTMNTHHSFIGAATKGKGKGKGKEKERETGERERGKRPLTRTSSVASSAASVSPSSVSSPASNYSFASASGSGSGADGDTSMTSPEPDSQTQTLMPPPPVPRSRQDMTRLPALVVCAQRPSNDLPSAPQPFAPPNAELPRPQRTVKQQSAAPHLSTCPSACGRPQAAPLAPNPNPPRQHPPHPNPLQQPLPRLLTHPPAGSMPSSTPETRLYPLLQQKPAAAPPARANALARPNPPPVPAPAVPPRTQSQPQQRRGPPALGMRRTNTAPLASQAQGPGQQRKFRPPLLNGASAAPVVVKVEAPPVQVKIEQVRGEVEMEMKAERDTLQPSTPARRGARGQAEPASSPSDASFSFDEHSSFDMEELEKVMKTY
ncbi:hypothetical protein DFH07DRAFT_856034, partial [Mycena maculata]